MRIARTTILGVLALAAVTWLAWTPTRNAWFGRRETLETRRVELQERLDLYRNGQQDHGRVTAAIAAYADRTLGGDRETVDHRLRSRLNRIGEDLGLEGLSVGTGRVRELQSPARNRPAWRGQQAIRDEIDFVEIEAWISGQAPIDAALKLLHRIDAEPWLKRVTQVRLQPRDNGERFAVTVRLVTLFLPGREAAVLPPEADDAGFDEYAPIVLANPFRVPEPQQAPVAAAALAPAPGFPLGEWMLTGIADASDDGAAGAEAWLLNSRTGETARLTTGQTLGGSLLLMRAGSDTAEFRLDDRHWAVLIGNRLSEGAAVQE